jgi:hypothetical protein
MKGKRKYSRWEDAMVAQTQLLEWSESRQGLRYLVEFFQDMNRKHRPDTRSDPRMLTAIQLEALRSAEPVYVSEDVTTLIDKARETFQPEKLLPGDVFCPRGFMVFPRPILIDDMPPTPHNPFRATPHPDLGHGYIPVRAISWMPLHNEDLSAGSYWISYYVAVDDEFDLADRWGVPSRFDMDDKTLAPLTGDELEARRAHARHLMPLSLVHMWQWSWGEGWGEWDDPERYDVMPDDSYEQMRERAKQQLALIQVTWRLAAQLVTTVERPIRQLWRDANRKGIKHKDVTVIRLRRSREGYVPPEGDGEGHLTYQFVVRGHWRNQWYPSLKDHRQVWIAPYVKGPEGTELRLTERAWEFTR